MRSANPAVRPSLSLQTLLRGAIDYAGLFPPAALPLSEAVANYASYRRGEFAWMLGRFVISGSKLAHFQETIQLLPAARDEPWRLSVIAESVAETEALHNLNSQPAGRPPRAVIDSFEIKARNSEEIQTASRNAPPGTACYFELPQDEALEECVAAVREFRCCAKVRCGGLRADQFISPENLARFIHLCVRAGVSFKATAGLHHPLRGRYPLTDEAGAPSVMMHGFLNLLMAIVFAPEGMDEAGTVQLLEDESPSRFAAGGASWRNHHAGAEQLSRAREIFHSFGSCSFTGPVRDLEALKLI